MLFQLSAGDRSTHCGVLEFTAEEGCVYIPFWMMQNLLIEEGSLLTVKNVSLPKATFVKLQPQSVDFLEISNPRAVLEHALRNFSCVTVGDVIQIPYNNKNYHFELKDVQPERAACIIETDCNVDFDAPVGYQEPTPRSSACPSPAMTQSTASSVNEEAEQKKPAGIRIVDGKIIRPEDEAAGPVISPELLAARTGGTGVQRNAAIPEAAPKVDYWAVDAGDGHRLDGKAPTPLKDATGQEIDIRKLRAEAAARRMEQASAMSASPSASTPSEASPMAAQAPSPAPISKRKKLGGKYSKLKQSAGVAFQGSAKTLQK